MKYIVITLIFVLNFSCKAKAQKTNLKTICIESTLLDSEYTEPVLIKTCKFKNYLFKSTGIADYVGRYSYKHELFKINKNDTIQVTNTDLFNNQAIALENLLNSKLKAEYDSNSKIPELSRCMEWIDFRHYKLNEFGISFTNKNQMEFNMDYQLGSACLNVSVSSIILEYSEVENYLR